ncbi:MAG: alpha/beta hydrolase [Bacteriovoracaceae bacterium]|nr:alpha/beta hydrolase [Bacteriovoracaceae bacterium]
MNFNDLIISDINKPVATFVMAHGAGAPMDHPWMERMATLLEGHSIEVVRFEFPYMVDRRLNGNKRPPNTAKVLQETWLEVLSLLSDRKRIFIGGKSMGGRMASLIADSVSSPGLICLGFPFHAPGKDVGQRIEHLADLSTKTLILQGTRDTMGNYDDVKEYILSSSIEMSWLEDGDHGLKPRVKSGYTLEKHLEEAARRISAFILGEID